MQLSRLVGALAVILAFWSTAALAAATINGTVTYRERIGLPPNAWLRVTLVDLSTMTPVVGASAGIPAKGQVPIRFVLNVEAQLDDAAGAYGLAAEISSADQVLFRSSAPYPVALGHDMPTAITVYPVPKQALPPEPPIPTAPAELVNTLWTVTSIGGRPVTGSRAPTLSIAADNRAGGFGGCNNYFTEASFEGTKLHFGPAAATRMACEASVTELETDYFTALSAVAFYELDGPALRLLDAAGIPLIGLVRPSE
ncbi:META domain-containing protein [uncultured Devosia sp.]|uniref:META domain-containing protein n=1 Tax=uncultured Devosia sp. TaxID=211434 RepID=UPI00260A2ED1|nr:META domain-containing protein [uncultured Devosia sp.]